MSYYCLISGNYCITWKSSEDLSPRYQKFNTFNELVDAFKLNPLQPKNGAFIKGEKLEENLSEEEFGILKEIWNNYKDLV